ncbi:MAG: hypothetical protein IGR93_07335 [Hydrococcus sp. C42_A2020_068]|uniref:hypothetical protein n=1 Tax=Pleurocapsa sp. PCC 7327 TaxID=118163 RepID=UPI00029F9165|nr:hypothetical protein [Pleurocapsa sp. PCC 7327]AFY79289.1 hypothetical protein Ple7327_4158 [Pleurocapsa sp. PCC 7327]MBF2019904.1 hypothetical protein [Hydrococcus sp. C42_A2020_068]
MKKLLTSVPALPLESQNFIETDPKERIKIGLKQLQAQSERINLLSAELERAILEFQAIATQVNQDSRFVRVQQRHAERFKICEYRSVYLPIIRQKSGGRFVVASRSIDLSKPPKPQQKPFSLVQKLRRWITRKPASAISESHE